jgi:F420H(2)-dependent quinone reductase
VALAEQVVRGVLRCHEAMYTASDGRIGHGMLGVPALLLRTTGRRSGQTRTNALIYARDGDRYLVVPSNGGAEKAPGWFHNLRADPRAEVQVGRERHPVTAKIVERGGPDFERLWKIVNDNNRDRYDGYQKGTDRQIPVVVLAPAGGAGR